MNRKKPNKQIVTIVIVMIVSAAAAFGQSILAAGSPAIGDVNKDGSIGIVDALVIAQAYVGIQSAVAYPPFGDTNDDGNVDIVDALLIARYYVGLIAGFPGKSPVDTVKAWADANSVNLGGYIIGLYGTKETATVLPGHAFVVLILRQYPVAYGPPDPLLGTNAIAAVDRSKAVRIITDTRQLVAFFGEFGIPATTEKMMLTTVKAWLSLSQELKDDGFYAFTIRDESLQILPVDSIQAQGTSEVTGGGSGALQANIWFGTPDYKVYNVVEKVELVPGIRPVCQSTKLLDPDPIVRKMAEQELLAMGRSCFDYLDGMRPKSSPAIRKAIDDIRRKILDRETRLERIREMLGK